jgi:hypothetical protein
LKFIYKGFCWAVYLAVYFFIVTGNVFAQDSSGLDGLVSRLDSVAIAHLGNDPLIKGSFDYSKLKVLFDTTSVLTQSSRAEIELLKSQKSVLDTDYGLGLDVGMTQNFDQGVFGAEGIFYQRRAQLGLQWDVLKNGYYDNKNSIGNVKGEIEIATKKAKAESLGELYQVQSKKLWYQFNIFRNERLEAYLSILVEQMAIAAKLYELNYISLDEVLNINSNKARVESEITSNIQFSNHLAGLTVMDVSEDDLPILKIDLERLIGDGLVFYDELQDLYTKNEYEPLNELSLSAFLRYNLYGGSGDQNAIQGTSNREFFSAGISMSLPLPLGVEKKRTVYDQKQKIRGLALQDQKRIVSDQVLELYNAYQSILKRYITNYQRYLVQEERIREQRIKKSISSDVYSPNELVSALSDRYAVSLDLLDIKQELYSRLLKLQSLMPDQSLLEYVSPMDIDKFFAVNAINFELFISSNSLRDGGPQSILEFLTTEDIKTVYVSAGIDKELLSEVEVLIKNQQANGNKTHLIIGEANLIFEDQYSKLKTHIDDAKAINANGVHIDVEPHTFDDWDEKKEEYFIKYKAMLSAARELTNEAGLELSVSAPLFYGKILSDIANLTDSIVLIPYGITDIQDFSQKVTESLLNEFYYSVIALRPGYFGSETEMKEFSKQINEVMGLKRIAIHDFQSWQEIKKQSF